MAGQKQRESENKGQKPGDDAVEGGGRHLGNEDASQTKMRG